MTEPTALPQLRKIYEDFVAASGGKKENTASNEVNVFIRVQKKDLLHQEITVEPKNVFRKFLIWITRSKKQYDFEKNICCLARLIQKGCKELDSSENKPNDLEILNFCFQICQALVKKCTSKYFERKIKEQSPDAKKIFILDNTVFLAARITSTVGDCERTLEATKTALQALDRLPSPPPPPLQPRPGAVPQQKKQGPQQSRQPPPKSPQTKTECDRLLESIDQCLLGSQQDEKELSPQQAIDFVRRSDSREDIRKIQEFFARHLTMQRTGWGPEIDKTGSADAQKLNITRESLVNACQTALDRITITEHTNRILTGVASGQDLSKALQEMADFAAKNETILATKTISAERFTILQRQLFAESQRKAEIERLKKETPIKTTSFLNDVTKAITTCTSSEELKALISTLSPEYQSSVKSSIIPLSAPSESAPPAEGTITGVPNTDLEELKKAIQERRELFEKEEDFFKRLQAIEIPDPDARIIARGMKDSWQGLCFMHGDPEIPVQIHTVKGLKVHKTAEGVWCADYALDKILGEGGRKRAKDVIRIFSDGLIEKKVRLAKKKDMDRAEAMRLLSEDKRLELDIRKQFLKASSDIQPTVGNDELQKVVIWQWEESLYIGKHENQPDRLFAQPGGVPLLKTPLRTQADFATFWASCGDVLRALIGIHERGFVHNDIKPDNVLTLNGRGKLTDFGEAGKTGGKRAKGKNTGTPAYLSPEISLGIVGTNDPRSDMYAFGVMLLSALDEQLGEQLVEINERYHQLGLEGKEGQEQLRKKAEAEIQAIQEQLSKRTGTKGPWKLIAALIHPDPQQRPTSVDAWKQYDAFLSSIGKPYKGL
jgi:hypothetical protein